MQTALFFQKIELRHIFARNLLVILKLVSYVMFSQWAFVFGRSSAVALNSG